MKRNHGFRAAAVVLCTLSGLTGPAGAATADRGDAALAAGNARLTGVWSWTDMQQCTESYEYRADGSGQVSSGDERTDVRYTLSPEPQEGDFFRLDVTIQHNSGGKDCLGESGDDAGETYTVFVTFQPDENTHLVCYQPDFTRCFGPLRRQPPGAH
jgi:hypothetical protein